MNLLFLNKNFIIYFVPLFILFVAFISGYFYQGLKTEQWSFVGYQYKWSDEYVERKGFKTEQECVYFGDEWLQKQTNSEAIFTCNLNSRQSNIPGIDTADKICEYGHKGFIQCRE